MPIEYAFVESKFYLSAFFVCVEFSLKHLRHTLTLALLTFFWFFFLFTPHSYALIVTVPCILSPIRFRRNLFLSSICLIDSDELSGVGCSHSRFRTRTEKPFTRTLTTHRHIYSIMRFVLIALVLVSALVGVLGSIPVATPPSSSGPLGQATLTPSGGIASEHPNPPTPNGDAPEQVPIRRHRYRKKVVAQPPKEEEKYLPGTDFLGAYGSVPINPTAHLQASLKDDKEYVASILRAPVDLGGENNEREGERERRPQAKRMR